MSRVSESVVVNASLAEVWNYYFDPRNWPLWVDGFRSVQAASGYPEAGGSLRWSSIPAGRGEVTEHVLEHEPRRLHRATFRDPASAGELRTTFAIEGEGTLVSQQLDYKLRKRGPFAWLTDRLFIRSQMRQSQRRSLARLKLEVEEAYARDPSS
jgi:uncharacterized membrane protein